jgi:hypothetical protein
MNVDTAPRLASDDGSGNEAHWRQWSAEMDGAEGYVVQDVGRTAMLGGRAFSPGFSPDFHTDRIMPHRDTLRHIGRFTIVPAISD